MVGSVPSEVKGGRASARKAESSPVNLLTPVGTFARVFHHKQLIA